MIMKNILWIKYLLAMFISLLVFNIYAQKLPSVQTISIYAPTNIKIDGKATEWDNKFQAHNNAIGVSYTIANDEENLYLSIQASDRSIITRVIAGGVTLTIKKEKKTDDIRITYPTYPTPDGKSPGFISFNTSGNNKDISN